VYIHTYKDTEIGRERDKNISREDPTNASFLAQ